MDRRSDFDTLLLFASLGWYGLHVLKAQQVRETVAVVERFHQHFNAGEFDKIRNEAIGCPEEVRKDWKLVLQDMADRDGKFREVKSSDGHVRILSFGTVWNPPPSADQQKFN